MKHQAPYKTAEELGIAQWEYDGLTALVRPLSRGELRLDMGFAAHPDYDCGAVCCVGGWLAYIYGGSRMRDYDAMHNYVASAEGKLRNLFFPYKSKGFGFYPNITAAHAARAIVNFLVTGDPQWDAAIQEPA